MAIADTVVILFLAALPLTGGTSLDRGAIAALAGCQPAIALISIAEDPDRGWIVIVRCHVPVVPTAEILRTEPWEASRQLQTPAGFPFGVRAN